jgi:hypothetical protein
VTTWPATPRGRWLLAFVLVVVGLALRYPRLTQSIWFDEAFRTFVIMKPDAIGDLLLHDVHNPLYNAFMYCWINAFGDGEISIRTPSLLAGAAMIVVVFRWLRSQWGCLPAWWAAMFLTMNPVHIWYSCEAKNNMFTVLMVTLTLYLLDGLGRALTVRWVVLAGVAGALAIWTDFQSLLALPAAWLAWTVLLARDKSRRGAWRVPLVAAALSLVLASPLLLFKAQRLEDLDRDYLTYFHWYEPLRMLVVYFPTGNALVPTVRATWPLAALAFAPLVAPALVWGVRRLRLSASGKAVLVTLMAPMLIMWAGSELLVQLKSGFRIFQDRNVLVMLPGVAICLAVGAFAVRTRIGSRLAKWGLLALTLASSAAMLTINREKRTVMWPNTNWRDAAAWLRAPGRDARLPILSRTPVQPLEYYLPDRRVVYLGARRPLETSLPAFVAESSATNAAMPKDFYFIQHEYWASFRSDTLAWIDAQHETVESHQTLHLTIRRLRPRAE